MKPEVERKIDRKLKQLGFKIEAEAKKKCPVDTGRLRASITTTVEGGKVIVGSNVKYAPYVEWGTEKMEAQPYLRPAIDLVRKKESK